ncbi:MAG TPA: LysR family transcriptional regulator [Pseudobdellovibrionaceae bacterium]|jgi:DNA-binding transcriptional LysR family regulator
MELNHLRCFYEVAKAGSFTAAARVLHISQSALSKAVALLEDREGVKLFERSKKGVALTALGQDIFHQCQLVFHGVQEIEDRVRGATQKCEGLLRFGTSDHLVRYLLIDRIKQFRHQYPKVTPSIFVGAPNEIIALVLKNELEFGLFFTKINTPGLEYKRITPFELVLVAETKTFPKITAKDVGDVGIVGSISREFKRHPSYRVFELTATPQKINIEANSQELQKRLCMAGEGCALLTRFMVKEELRSQKLREIKLSKPLLTDLLLVKRKGHVFTRPAQKFVEEVALLLKSEDSSGK